MRRTTVAALAVLFLSTPASPFDITTPGQTIGKRDPGVLQADLLCDPPAVGILLENGARLYLNGHVLDGCYVSVASASQTEPQRIRVFGPGTIRRAGIRLRAGKLRVRNVVIEDSPTWGILGSGDANDGPSRVAATNVIVTGSGQAGIDATKVVARNVTSSGNGVAGPFGYGIVAWAGLRARSVTVEDNAAGGIFVAWGRLSLKRSRVSGNAGIGVYGDPLIRITDSTVDGNNTGGDPLGADVASQVLPKLKNSTCGTSLNVQTMTPWGICTND